LAPKFEAFGWTTKRVNGHSFAALDEALAAVPFAAGYPSVLIADTVRGRGLPSIQERADRWFCNFTHEEVNALLEELRGESRAEIESEALIVR
jgi:transketolase